MWIADGWNDYEVLDTSAGEKLAGAAPGSASAGTWPVLVPIGNTRQSSL